MGEPLELRVDGAHLGLDQLLGVAPVCLDPIARAQPVGPAS